MALSGPALLCLAPEKDEQTVDPRSPWSPGGCTGYPLSGFHGDRGATSLGLVVRVTLLSGEMSAVGGLLARANRKPPTGTKWVALVKDASCLAQ